MLSHKDKDTNTPPPITYKQSGVDKEEGYAAVNHYKRLAARTHNASVLSGVGGFAALYELKNYREPVLVSGTDGVGTKLAIAMAMGRWNTIGIDCVAMCVNDVLCQGARPLFFLDYLACGKLNAQEAADIVEGVTRGCELAGAALIGGETAEMPGFYDPGKYDIAGFCVGAVEKSNIVDGSKIQPGDVLLGLPSSGFHSNGYSLLRKLFTNLDEVIEGQKIGDVLLTPTEIYVPAVLPWVNKIKGMAHITGGGWIENIPRMFANKAKALEKRTFAEKKLGARIKKPNISSISKTSSGPFAWVLSRGVSLDEALGTFNMGIGFVICVSPTDVDEILRALPQAQVMGEVAVQEEGLCFV